jgi:molybdate transport system substrate-binding protein
MTKQQSVADEALAWACAVLISPDPALIECAGRAEGPVMTRFPYRRSLITAILIGSAVCMADSSAKAGAVEVFHADSLAGPMAALKQAFEGKNAGVEIKLTSGTSKALAERIIKGETCDVFAPSAPAVIDEDLIGKRAANGQDGASWYVVFSANEMAVITARGNPLGFKQVSDLAKPGVKFVRITAEKDLGTPRTIEFLKRAANLEGKPELAQKIIDGAMAANSVPDTVKAVREGAANVGIVYLSAAVAAKNDIEIVRFPAKVNMSEAIRNAATVPGTAKNAKEAADFIKLILSAEGQKILEETGQPPVVPALKKGNVPAEITN